MAISRVGGTKGKLSGQVGSTIYQIRKNTDGTFTQIAYNKGERTETTFSPKLQAQRMCMGMVESLMKQLKPLIGISFQAGTNKTKSCNAFSAANLRLVQRDCMEHWYANNKFVFPLQYKGYPDFSELGGPYMISSGSLKDNLYDELLFDSYAPAQWRDLPYTDSALWGLKFNVRVGVDTLEQFRQAHKMTILDKICFAGFKTWISYEPDPEDPQTLSKHDYFIASFDRSVPSNVVLSPDVLVGLFKFNTNADPRVYISRDNDAICVGCCLDFQHADESYYYWAGFSESHLTGKKQISTSFYGNDLSDSDPYLVERQPSMVFGSWMGEPQRKPYPSPWSITPTPRLPLAYQEVEWIRNISGSPLQIPNLCRPFVHKSIINIEFETVVGAELFRYYQSSVLIENVFKTSGSTSAFFINCTVGSNPTVSNGVGYRRASFNNNIIFEPYYGGYNWIVGETSRSRSLDYFQLNDNICPFYFWLNNLSLGVLKVFESRFFDVRDNSLALDLVPCYRRSDGFCGFYDLVSGTFFTSQLNTGEFDHGNNVYPQ